LNRAFNAQMNQTIFNPGLFNLNVAEIQSIQSKNWLVTGGAGFIGSHLVETLLLAGAKSVTVLDNLSTGFSENISPWLQNPAFRFLEGSIIDKKKVEEAMAEVDVVLHQAALGSVPRSIKDPLATHQANVTGFITVLNAAKDVGIKRVVYASSSSVYGDSPKLPKSETDSGKPLSPYAATKWMNEIYADIFARTYELEIIGLRYFNIFGPRQSPNGPYAAVIPLFIERLKNGLPCEINGNGTITRDFTHVANAVQANLKAALIENEVAISQVYNVACGEQLSLNDLVAILSENLGVKIPSTYREERPGDIKASLADINKAQNLLGYFPQVSVKSGLENLIQFD